MLLVERLVEQPALFPRLPDVDSGPQSGERREEEFFCGTIFRIGHHYGNGTQRQPYLRTRVDSHPSERSWENPHRYKSLPLQQQRLPDDSGIAAKALHPKCVAEQHRQGVGTPAFILSGQYASVEGLQAKLREILASSEMRADPFRPSVTDETEILLRFSEDSSERG